MNIQWVAYQDDPDTKRHITLILVSLMAYGSFSAPILSATVYQDHTDLLLTDDSTRELYFYDGLPSFVPWTEQRFPSTPMNPDRRIALSAKVITGQGQN